MHRVADTETAEVKIHDLSRGGNGVAKLESGAIVFVPFSMPGDHLEIEIIPKKKNYSEGRILKIITPSPDRVQPKCSVFGQCGGCTWQHVPYEIQFETKKTGLLHTLKRSGVKTEGIPVEEFPAKNHYGYRNRIQLRGSPDSDAIGYFERGTNTLTAIQTCPIADPKINEAIPQIQAQGNQQYPEGYKVEIEVTHPSGKVRSTFNSRNASFGFRQVNDEQNGILQSWIHQNIQDAELLLDLYGGSGNLSIDLASRFEEITCVDVGSPTVRPKDVPDHFKFVKGDVLRYLQKTVSQSRVPTSVILDPPREGLGTNFREIETLLRSKFSIRSIILVSCDVDSFAKDSSRFIQKGYHLKSLALLDLFPQTPHLESLALFTT